ncbi:MAG: aldose 1-epimerase [Actinomycetota bacterium]|nr:MAG: aldose 1-epimerase [Actinomycetota bacterium]
MADYDVTHGKHPDHPELATVTLSSPSGLRATFVPGAGMVGCSLTDDGVELLGLRGGMSAYLDRGSSFGIPLLAPWANRLSSLHYEAAGQSIDLSPTATGIRIDGDTGQPIHGLFAAHPDWDLATSRAPIDGPASVTAHLDHVYGRPRFESFPYTHRLTVTASLMDRTLTIATTLAATGTRHVPVAFGWHPYLAPAGADRADWELDVPLTRRVVTGADHLPTGEVVDTPALSGPLGDATHETLYAEVPEGARASVTGGGRRLALTIEQGYSYALLWAPADPKAVCIEPMTAPIDPFSGRFPLRTVAPGGWYTGIFSITVEAV